MEDDCALKSYVEMAFPSVLLILHVVDGVKFSGHNHGVETSPSPVVLTVLVSLFILM